MKDKVVQNSKYLSQTLLSNYIKEAKSLESANIFFEEPFKDLKFNKVIAYDFDGDEEKYATVFDNKTRIFNPVVLHQKELNKEQIENLISFLIDSKTYGEGIAACFVPHLGIVFYHDNQFVFEVDVCLDCNYLESTIEIPARKTKKIKLEDGSDLYLIGFSKIGKQKIIGLCKELNLDYRNYQ